jgi:hypothetical protein
VQLIGGLSALAVGAVLFLVRRKPEPAPQRLA